MRVYWTRLSDFLGRDEVRKGRRDARSYKIGYVKQGVLRAAILAACCLLLNARALAQHSSVGIGIYNPDTAYAPEFTLRDLTIMTRVLKLGDAEREALETLYQGYSDGLKARSREIREIVTEALERAEVMEDARLVAEASAKQETWDKQAEEMKKAFLTDLKSLLSGEQEGRWPIVERELRRVKQIGHARLPGESVDLIRVVDDILDQTPPPPPLAEAMEQYAANLDIALQARERYLTEHSQGFDDLIQSDPGAAESKWNESQRLRTAIRDLNLRYVKILASHLGTAQAADLEKRFFEAANARVLTATRAEAYIRAAAALEGLSASQRSEIKPIAEDYEKRRLALVQRLADAWWQECRDDMPRTLRGKLGRLREGESATGWDGKSFLPKDHPLMRLRQERFELDRNYRRQVDAILTDAQRDEIPEDRVGWAQFTDWSPGGL